MSIFYIETVTDSVGEHLAGATRVTLSTLPMLDGCLFSPYWSKVSTSIVPLEEELRHSDIKVLENLTFCLPQGDEEIWMLVQDFAQLAHRLTTNTNLQKHRIWASQVKRFASDEKKHAQRRKK